MLTPRLVTALPPTSPTFNRDQVSAFLHHRKRAGSWLGPGGAACVAPIIPPPHPCPIIPPGATHTRTHTLGWTKAASQVDHVRHLVYVELGGGWEEGNPATVEWREERASTPLALASGQPLLGIFGRGDD